MVISFFAVFALVYLAPAGDFLEWGVFESGKSLMESWLFRVKKPDTL